MTITRFAPRRGMNAQESEVVRREQPKEGSSATPVSDGEECLTSCRNKLMTKMKPVNVKVWQTGTTLVAENVLS